MRAWGGFAEAGYRWADVTWSPSLSYRLSAFSGDRLSTRTFERWDPLLSGGSGEEWVQEATALVGSTTYTALGPCRRTKG